MQRPIQICLTLVAVVIATVWGGVFGFPPNGISTFWPPNAILFASILSLSSRDRLTCLVLAYPAYLGAELWIGFDFVSSLVFSGANCLAVGLGYGVMRLLGDVPTGLRDLRRLLSLFLAVSAASVVGGIIGAGWVAISGGAFAQTVLRWGFADLIGYLVFAPVVLTLSDWVGWSRKSGTLERTEAAVSTVLVIVLSLFAYGPLHPFGVDFRGMQFLPIPVILWMALRLGPKGAALSLLAVSFIALTYAINGFGPFSDLSPENNVASLQIFITSIVIATFLVAVLLQERDSALRLLSEKDQQEKEARYRALVDLATDGIMIFNVDDGRFIEANPKSARIFGYSTVDLLNSIGPADLSPEFQTDGRRSDEASRDYLMQALEGEFPTFEWMHRNRDGQNIPCEIELARFPDPERNLVRASITDVTERKEAEERRRDLEEQLMQSQKLEAVGQMTGGVAHDFNNLLNVILGNLELLRDETMDAESVKLIDAAIGATARGADLTKNMLSFARRADLHPTRLDLSDIVQHMDNWIARTIPASIRVEKSLEADLWPVEADRSTTESALLNLMINARDAITDGGVITLETSNVVLDHPLESGIGDDLDAGRYALLAVSDTGAGIPEDNIQHAFEPFYTTKGLAEGSGLGLSMVHGFMRQSGGGARIYSEVGIGTTVKLYFPASRSTEEEREITEPTGAISKPDIEARILIAEDQADVLDLLVRILENEGHTVVPSRTGDQALGLFKADQTFDLLVTDIVMPGRLQGPDLARRIRSINSSIPVVFMSGYAREATIHGNGLRDSDIRLMKPVAKKDLIAAVQEALSAR
ncbi:MAG: MASE1 domain-containing protein [Paracoccaceae bacterium]|nr:MASE1 domain-containing protein [Paracoccaceae bacterium]